MFDAPGSGAGNGQGTQAHGITSAGDIVGYVIDNNNVSRGFIRNRDGSFEFIDAPGAATTSGRGTRALAMDDAGNLGGWFTDSTGTQIGFVRKRK
jgi:hypothetical protein